MLSDGGPSQRPVPVVQVFRGQSSVGIDSLGGVFVSVLGTPIVLRVLRSAAVRGQISHLELLIHVSLNATHALAKVSVDFVVSVLQDRPSEILLVTFDCWEAT